MHSQSYSYDLDRRTWSAAPDGGLDSPRTLVLAFGTADVANHARIIEDLSKTFPKALVVGCSTAGEIHDTAVRDRSVAVAPGLAFGASGQHRLRISLASADDELLEGCRRLADYLRR